MSKLTIQYWVKNELIPQHLHEGILEQPLQPFSCSYFPTNKDLRNMAHHATMKRRHSLFDKEALEVLLKEQAQSKGQLEEPTTLEEAIVGPESMKLWKMR